MNQVNSWHESSPAHYRAAGGAGMSGMFLRLLSAPLTSPPVGSCFMALNVVTVTSLHRVSGTGALNFSTADVALATRCHAVYVLL